MSRHGSRRGQSRSEGLRWRVASFLDRRLTGQCWADLVSWALDGKGLPWKPITDTCRQDARECGTCYCNRLRRKDVDRT